MAVRQVCDIQLMGVLLLFSFTPKLPVGPEERAWIEQSLAWLTDTFGDPRTAGIQPVLPTEDFFPDSFDGTPESVQRTLNRVCSYMKVTPDRLRLEIFDGAGDEFTESLAGSVPETRTRQKGAGGYFVNPVSESEIIIAVRRRTLKNPIALVATFAHELGHVRLLADNVIARDVENMEPLTDLFTVFCGMGIFTANASLQFAQFHNGWSAQRLGYLSQEMFGYALAVWSWRRQEPNPAWTRYLSTNVRTYCQQSLKVLQRDTRRAAKSPAER